MQSFLQLARRFITSHILYAAMAELVDALDSGSSRGNSVDVRVILAAFLFHIHLLFFAPSADVEQDLLLCKRSLQG